MWNFGNEACWVVFEPGTSEWILVGGGGPQEDRLCHAPWALPIWDVQTTPTTTPWYIWKWRVGAGTPLYLVWGVLQGAGVCVVPATVGQDMVWYMTIFGVISDARSEVSWPEVVLTSRRYIHFFKIPVHACLACLPAGELPICDGWKMQLPQTVCDIFELHPRGGASKNGYA